MRACVCHQMISLSHGWETGWCEKPETRYEKPKTESRMPDIEMELEINAEMREQTRQINHFDRPFNGPGPAQN